MVSGCGGGRGKDDAGSDIRAWEGKAGPQDAEILAEIVAAAPADAGAGRPHFSRSRGRSWFAGWPAVDAFPSEEVIWNLEGQQWAEFYATACRQELLSEDQMEVSALGGAGLRVWSEWRPDWPTERVEALMGWAWRNLKDMGEATPERAAAIANRITNPSDQVLFVALCGQKELLTRWCQEPAFVKQIRTVSLMWAARVFQRKRQQTPLTPEEARAALYVAMEVAQRMGMTLQDLIRTQPGFQPANAQELSEAIGSVAATRFATESGAAGGVLLVDEEEARLESSRRRCPAQCPILCSVSRFVLR